MDGKTLRGSRDEDGWQTKLLAVFDHTDHLALSQVQVVGADELAAFTPALDTIADLRGVLVTADALHCQRAHAAYRLITPLSTRSLTGRSDSDASECEAGCV